MLNRLKQLQSSTKGYIGIPIVLLMVLAMVILPLPPLLLDALFTFNIVLAILVLLVSTTAKRPLDFFDFSNHPFGRHATSPYVKRRIYPYRLVRRP